MDSIKEIIMVNCGKETLALSIADYNAAVHRAQGLIGDTGCIPPENPPPRLLTAKQMEDRTAVPETWYLEKARRGELPHHRFGKYPRFDLDEVLASTKFSARCEQTGV